MITIRDLMAGGHRNPEAEPRLSQAWTAILEGRGSREDAELAVNDLAYESGYHYLPLTASDADLREHYGARKVFARILFLLDVPMTKLDDMRRASLRELQSDEE